MKDNKKTWVIASVFFIVTMVVAFNFERFTGQAITSSIPPKIYLSASPTVTNQENCTITAGNRLFVTVETGDKGIKRNGLIYDGKRTSRKLANLMFDPNCGGNVCRPKKVTWIRYAIPNGWKGPYCVRVVESSTNKITEKCFEVK
ncbi:MAG: hypothetical protein V1645_02895 [archaeon]